MLLYKFILSTVIATVKFTELFENKLSPIYSPMNYSLYILFRVTIDTIFESIVIKKLNNNTGCITIFVIWTTLLTVL